MSALENWKPELSPKDGRDFFQSCCIEHKKFFDELDKLLTKHFSGKWGYMRENNKTYVIGSREYVDNDGTLGVPITIYNYTHTS